MGHEVKKIHEVWHFREEDRHMSLFSDYVNTWLKIKQECAGWPDDCTTPEQKQAYITAYEEKQGIRLEHVQKNPSRKTIAKLMLKR